MVIKVALVAAGHMGAAVGQRIAKSALYSVHTVVEGRSEATRRRAIEAGLHIAPDLKSLLSPLTGTSGTLSESNPLITLSILPPKDALDFARSAASVLAEQPDKGRHHIFVDCNAVAPSTASQVPHIFKDSGLQTTVIDSCIIGGPPRERDGYSPTFYFSSENPKDAAKLGDLLSSSGLDVKVLEGVYAAASSLKMSFAAISKGTHALVALSMIGASQHEALPSLLEALAHTWPPGLNIAARSGETLPLKSYRWIGEMREIGTYFRDSGIAEGAEVFEGIARVFERAERAGNREGEEGERDRRIFEEASAEAQDLLKKPTGPSAF